MQPATRTPKALTANGGTKIAAAMTGTIERSMPATAVTYSAPSTATTGAPAHTPNMNQ